MSIEKIRSRQEALAIQFTGDNEQAVIDFIGENYLSVEKVSDMMKKSPSDLSEEFSSEDELWRFVINPGVTVPYWLHIFPQDWLLKKTVEDFCEFSVLSHKEFQCIGKNIEKEDSVMQFTGKNQEAIIQWIGKKHYVDSWPVAAQEAKSEFRMIIDPRLPDFYPVFLGKNDWLLKKFCLPSYLELLIEDECLPSYQFEVLDDETFNKHYEIIEKNVAINTPLLAFTHRKIKR